MTNAPQSPVDWEAVPGPSPAGRQRRPFDAWRVLRILVCTFGLLSLAFWGYWSWQLPCPATCS